MNRLAIKLTKKPGSPEPSVVDIFTGHIEHFSEVIKIGISQHGKITDEETASLLKAYKSDHLIKYSMQLFNVIITHRRTGTDVLCIYGLEEIL